MRKIIILFFFTVQIAYAQKNDAYRLENPVDASWLKANINKQSPKLILTPQIEKSLRVKLKQDPLLQGYYSYLSSEAEMILKEPLLERKLEGFRLLAVSREMVRRMTTLCMVYRLERKPEILKRIDEEVRRVCSFQDWNPQHFLDIAEMSFAVAIAADWAGKDLPSETVRLAKECLIEKGIKPGYNEEGTRMFWIKGTNNWNAVCHSGMIAASIVIADTDPELAARTISRALGNLPGSLSEYAPDGIYPEGPTYWSYGTSYTVIAANMLTTALGKDFGISGSPGFLKSADFLMHVTAPSGSFFNFADSGDDRGGDQAVLLSWFASKTGDAIYFDKAFFEKPKGAGRFGSLALIWLSQFNPEGKSKLPVNWYGNGVNPVAVFGSSPEDKSQFYLAAKGGKAALSHGNMDAGSFVFDLDGVRWVIDPGNQNYYPLNKVGFNLSGVCQDCPRWTLLTKGNHGHSTVVVNDERFAVDGLATIKNFRDGENPEVSIDMSALYPGTMASFTRTYRKESSRSLLIDDNFEATGQAEYLTWNLMTTADVILAADGAFLEKEGKKLELQILSPAGVRPSVISLDPPPLPLDKTIPGLKRIEIRIPAWILSGNKGNIRIRLSGVN